MTNPHDRTHPMDLLERKFENDSEAHTLLAILDAARHNQDVWQEVWQEEFYMRVHRCVCEHIRLSGDVYDRR